MDDGKGPVSNVVISGDLKKTEITKMAWIIPYAGPSAIQEDFQQKRLRKNCVVTA